MKTLRWSQEALDDLAAIHAYISSDSQVYANRMLERLLAVGERVAEHPDSGRSVPEFNLPWLRELIVGNYRLIYKVGSDQVYIAAVIHGRRDLGGMKDSFSQKQ